MPDNTARQIASKLKQIRLQKGMTQSQVAEKAGVNVNLYARIERGEVTPSIPTLKKLAKALGVKSEAILQF